MISKGQFYNTLGRVTLDAQPSDVSEIRAYIDELHQYQFSAENQFARANRILTLTGKIVDDFYDNRDEYSKDPAKMAEYALARKVLEILGAKE